MSWEQKEKVIKEKRTTQAVSKNFFGPTGKISIILKAYGSPVMRQGGTFCDVNYLEDPFEDYSDTEYETTVSGQNGPVAWRDEILEDGDGAGIAHENNPNYLGSVFDGLSRGIHIEIQQMRHSHTMVVNYKGYEVYKEVAGELEAYAPFPEWEDAINRLYKSAKTKYEEIKGQNLIELTDVIDRKKSFFWEKLRRRWGF